MDQDSSTGTARGLDRSVTVGAAVVGGLALIVLLTQGVGQALGVLGLAVFVVGGAVAVRGRSRRLGIGSRRVAGGVLAAGLAVMTVGTAVSPSVPTDTAAADAAATSAARTTSATTSRSTSAPAERPFIAVPTATATTTQAPVLPPAPAMAMTCPAGGTNASPVYGQQITATGPYSVTITYGDGDSYTDDDQSLAAIFSHTYASPGSYLVQALLTDVAGQTVTAQCTYAWTAPPPPPAAAPRPAPAPAPAPAPVVGGGSGGGGAYYQNCDDVRAAGAAPIFRGDPGFQAKFDRDGDGVGCEN